MIVGCSACGARFLVPDEALGAKGRKVKCGACGETWFQEPEASAALSDVDLYDQTEIEEESSATPDISADDSVDTLDADPETTAVEESKASTKASLPARGDEPHGLVIWVRAVPRALSVFGLIVLVFFSGLILARGQVVAAFPSAAGLFTPVGIAVPVAGEGLSLTITQASLKQRGAEPVLYLKGNLLNSTNEELEVPDLIVRQVSAFEDEMEWELPMTDVILNPETETGLEYALPDPLMDEAAVITLSFQ